MIRIRGRIEYVDGRVVDFEAGSAMIAEWELYAMRHGYPVGEGAPAVLSSLVVVHATLGVEEGFDVWRKTVSSIETEAEGLPVPPTLPALSEGP